MDTRLNQGINRIFFLISEADLNFREHIESLQKSLGHLQDDYHDDHVTALEVSTKIRHRNHARIFTEINELKSNLHNISEEAVKEAPNDKSPKIVKKASKEPRKEAPNKSSKKRTVNQTQNSNRDGVEAMNRMFPLLHEADLNFNEHVESVYKSIGKIHDAISSELPYIAEIDVSTRVLQANHARIFKQINELHAKEETVDPSASPKKLLEPPYKKYNVRKRLAPSGTKSCSMYHKW